MGHVEDAGEVDRDDVFPILDYSFRRTKHAVAPRDAGIVDQDRDLSDLAGDLLGDGDAVRAPGHVERKTLRLAVGIANFPRRLGRRLLVRIKQHQSRALAGITERDRAADAGASAQ